VTIITAPKNWRSDKIEHRFLGSTPSSYNEAEHTCECVISAGAEVNRTYGKETLRITREAIDLSRMPVPLLDSHNQTTIDNVLGVIESAWVSDGKLYGRIRFAQTAKGKRAEGMVARSEVTGISAGYTVTEWSVRDADGDPVDEDNIGWRSGDLTFVATRWTLYEGSLTGLPADIASAVRRAGGGINIYSVEAVRERMHCRERMHAAASAADDNDYDVAAIIDRVSLRHAEMEENSALLDAELEIADQSLN
jgi:hypothetical protein